jgi:hypothetical protein
METPVVWCESRVGFFVAVAVVVVIKKWPEQLSGNNYVSQSMPTEYHPLPVHTYIQF